MLATTLNVCAWTAAPANRKKREPRSAVRASRKSGLMDMETSLDLLILIALNR
jgi:hypothetical protein